MTMSMPSCFGTVRTDRHDHAESRKKALGMKDSIFCFSCGGDGWVREYVYKVFRVALCGILYICVELWLSLRPRTYR